MRMIALAAMLSAAPALAQEPPTQLAATVRTFSGTWDAPGDTDSFTVRLEKGRDYAIGCLVWDDPGHGRGRLREPDGDPVGKEWAIGDETVLGIEWRAQAGGDYRITLTEGIGVPNDYSCWIDPDCRPVATTACRLAPGQSKRWPLTSWSDIDQVKLVNLVSGRRYTLSAEGSDLTMQLVTSTGTVKAAGNPLAFKGAAGLYARLKSTRDASTFELTLR
jgi:hypothetical protein